MTRQRADGPEGPARLCESERRPSTARVAGRRHHKTISSEGATQNIPAFLHRYQVRDIGPAKTN